MAPIPAFSGDVLFWHNLGIGAEVFWRASQADNYLGDSGFNYRPLFYDFNAVYSPKLARHMYLELVGGIGRYDTRIYECNSVCGTDAVAANYQSSNHFDVDLWRRHQILCQGRFLRSSRGAVLLDQQQYVTITSGL